MIVQTKLTYVPKGQKKRVEHVIQENLPESKMTEAQQAIVMSDVKDYHQMLARLMYRVADTWHLSSVTN